MRSSSQTKGASLWTRSRRSCSSWHAGTEHRVTSTYHPQSNRLTETFNQTLQTALIKVNQWYTRWQLSSVLFIYRTAQQKATKMSPLFEVMFCRQVQVLITYYCWQNWSLFSLIMLLQKTNAVHRDGISSEHQGKTTSWQNGIQKTLFNKLKKWLNL